MPIELLRTIEAIIVLAGIGALFVTVLKANTTKATIQSQKDLIDTLTVQVNELRKLHEDNSKEIGRLTGQVEVYKEIPLKDIAESIMAIKQNQDKHIELLERLLKKG